MKSLKYIYKNSFRLFAVILLLSAIIMVCSYLKSKIYTDEEKVNNLLVSSTLKLLLKSAVQWLSTLKIEYFLLNLLG